MGISGTARCALYVDIALINPKESLGFTAETRVDQTLDLLMQYSRFLTTLGFLVDIIFFPEVAMVIKKAGICASKECLLQRSVVRRHDFMESDISKSKVDALFPSQAFSHDAASKVYLAALSIGTTSIPSKPGLSKQYSVYICMNPCDRSQSAQGVQNRTAYEARVLSSYSLVVTSTHRRRSQYITEHNDIFSDIVKTGLRVPMIRSQPVVPIKDPASCRDEHTYDIPTQFVLYHRESKSSSGNSEFPLKIVVARAKFSPGWVTILADLNAALSRSCGVQRCIVHIIANEPVDPSIAKAFVDNLSESVDLRIVASGSSDVVAQVIMNSNQLWSVSGISESLQAINGMKPSPRANICPASSFFDPDAFQAMYCNVPVIALDVCDISEFIPAFPIDSAGAKQSLVAKSVRSFGDLSLVIAKSNNAVRERYSKMISSTARDLTLREVKRQFMKLFTKQLLHSRYTSFALDRIGALRSQVISTAAASKLLALTVEPWLHPTLEFAVRNVMMHLGPKWALQIVHSDANRDIIRALFPDLENAKYIATSEVDDSLKDVWSAEDYSDLLKSKRFWERLKHSGYEHVLIFQSDSLMLHGRIEPFLAYDYIGAPWCHDSPYVARLREKEHVLKNGLGNGGFSLRRVDAMIEAIESSPQFKGAKKLSEDLFFASYLDTIENSARFPNRYVGFTFSIEVQCSDEPESHVSLRNIPLGVHAAWLFGARYKETLFQVMDVHFME
jgi:hypothetical protein